MVLISISSPMFNSQLLYEPVMCKKFWNEQRMCAHKIKCLCCYSSWQRRWNSERQRGEVKEEQDGLSTQFLKSSLKSPIFIGPQLLCTVHKVRKNQIWNTFNFCSRVQIFLFKAISPFHLKKVCEQSLYQAYYYYYLRCSANILSLQVQKVHL